MKAWAIRTSDNLDTCFGVGWFDGKLARPGFAIMTWATRHEARAALRADPSIRHFFPRARVTRVTIRVTVS
ncbi:MAG: hypothetical protein HYV99_02420 [Betaproteobacteria bacterium]|nr:hypothetical protein [Betaproteobacteria bacterium]